MTARTVLVAMLVVASGCQLLDASGQGTGTPTATPAPVPTVTAETAAGADLPPGISTDGVTDVGELARAHVRAAIGTRYVWRERWRTSVRNDTAPARVSGWQLRLVNGTYYHVEPIGGGAGGLSDDVGTGGEWFADGEYRYTRRGGGGNRTDRYAVFPANNASVGLTRPAADSIGAFLDLPGATVTADGVDGERRYVITARTDVYEPVDAYNYSVRAVVTPEGFVERLAVRYATGPGASGTSVQRYSFEYGRVGTATVRAPDWIDEARAALDGLDAAGESQGPSNTPVAVYLSNAGDAPTVAETTDTDDGATGTSTTTGTAGGA